MLANGQTLIHKKTKKLARLIPERTGSAWAWPVSKKTPFVDEAGNEFVDDINNYACIRDEFGKPYFKQPKEGQFIDESAKKYLVSEEEFAEMRQKIMEECEKAVLSRMAGNIKMHLSKLNADGTKEYSSFDCPKKSVSNPFWIGGSAIYVFRDFFLKRRGAVPLYREWVSLCGKGEFRDGKMVFRHTDGQIWMHDSPHMNNLVVIEEGSIQVVL